MDKRNTLKYWQRKIHGHSVDQQVITEMYEYFATGASKDARVERELLIRILGRLESMDDLKTRIGIIDLIRYYLGEIRDSEDLI